MAGEEGDMPDESEVALMPVQEAENAEFWTSGVGDWDGQTYSLKYFPCMPDSTEDGALTWSQTMGKLYVCYELTGQQAGLTVDDLKVEVSRMSIKVSVTGGSKKDKNELKELTGQLHGTVRAGTTEWNIMEVEGSKRLYITLHKFEHMSWRNFLYDDTVRWQRQTFAWNTSAAKGYNADDERLRAIPAEEPMDSLEVPSDVSFQNLCIGLDDFQDSEEYVTATVRFDPAELRKVNLYVPTEEFLGADVTEDELTVYFRVYDRGEPVVAFRGVLEGKCVPQLTTWEFVQNLACDHPLIAGYTPALRVVMTKQSDSQGMWSRAFKQAKHASELHAVTRDQGGRAPVTAAPIGQSAPQGPRINGQAVATKYKELIKDGVPSREATRQAIAFVRGKAAAGEPWALESAMGTMGFSDAAAE